jgi:hypothetical protein
MDRQPLTDRLGDRLLAEYGGAAAAYSLRALNGNGDSVVRVRRASDNDEKDFTALQVSSGELTNWVNSQIVPPLDIGVETSEGRIPVPEGGTSIGIPAAAYSLRNLSTTYTGNVVDVRRSRNNAVASFTAAEVADGTLEAWVTEEQVVWNLQPTWDISVGNGVITSQSSTATTSTFSVTTISGESFVRQSSKPNHIIASSGDRVLANITLSGFDVPVSARLRTAGTNTNVAEQTLSNGTADYTFTLTGSGGYFAFSNIEATSGATLTINSIKVIGRTGFVTKWYDQSGNGNHATDETPASQPKIVKVGSLVTKLGQPSIDFTTGSTVLLSDSFSITETESAVFAIWQPAQDSATTVQSRNRTLFGNVSSEIYIGTPNADSQMSFKRFDAVKTFTLGLASLNTPNLHAFVGTTAGADYYFNGSSIYSDTATGTNSIRNHLRIGAKQNLDIHDTEGYISELIIYDSDQSANRTAIEANIGETYGITGIPAYDNTVDGFVETWYDQSGNGNDATQATIASQPKIVDGGVFLGEVDFDGVSAFLETNNSGLANLSELSLFSVLEPVTASVNEFAISAGSIVNSTGNYGGWALWANGFVDRLDFATQARGNATNSRAQLEITSTSPVVYSATLNGTDAQASLNGVLGTENTSMITPNNTDVVRRKLRLGCQYTFEPASFYSGAIKEVVLYTTDQSDNRVAIETNINAHYDIYP